MIQLRMAGELPDLAVYAQQRGAEDRPWADVERAGERPVVYVARGSHTGYFAVRAALDRRVVRPRRRPGAGIDPALEILGDDPPGWVMWPGTWGGTTAARADGVQQPQGARRPRAVGRSGELLAPPGDRNRPRRPSSRCRSPTSAAGDGTLAYAVPAGADVAALAVTVSIPGVEDSAATYTFPVDQPKGVVELPETPGVAYVLTVSAVSAAGDVGEATTLEVGAPTPEPEPDAPAPRRPPCATRSPASSPTPPRGRTASDIMADVRSLATVVAAKSVDPPLSIGLFGEWGSGKSFFMGKMREHVDRLQDETRKADGESAYCGHIRQIVFNAWHYADANLWASLVTHIFESLAGEGDDRARLAALLKTTAVQRAHADERLEAATTEEKAAQRELDEVLEARGRHQARGRRSPGATSRTSSRMATSGSPPSRWGSCSAGRRWGSGRSATSHASCRTR